MASFAAVATSFAVASSSAAFSTITGANHYTNYVNVHLPIHVSSNLSIDI